jgi:hypothetical protein
MKISHLTEGYSGYELDKAQRAALLQQFPPLFPDVIAHHITTKFGTNKNDALPPTAKTAEIIGEAVDPERAVQALVVAINGSPSRPDGSLYHITWSLDRSKGAKPVHSNEVIKQRGYKKVAPVALKLSPKFWPF